ncbi:MAG: hypothetical protein NZM04_01235, partial [Methylacidiphilales bacterium]|nr:hypothetical protein [Candidatus Methylacidiphilales bacterium]
MITLIQQGQIQSAQQAAQAILQESIAKQNTYQNTLSTLLTQAQNGQVVQPPIRPHRPPVVAIRLAKQFHLAGASDIAQFFYQEALRLNPLGAVQAKAGLSEILLKQGNIQESVKLARESLRAGKGKRHALGIWDTIIKAEQANKGAIDLNKAFAILKQATPSVRARQVHELVKALRRRGDDRWKQVIIAWRQLRRPAQRGNKNRPPIVIESQEFPETDLNLAKLELADAKRTYPQDPRRIQALCQSILANPALSSREFVQVAKDLVRVLQPGEQTSAILTMLETAEKRYPSPTAQLAIRHSLAKEAAALGHDALARTLWQRTLAQTSSGSEYWGKALWSLAKLEKKTGNWKIAAETFDTYARTPGVPSALALMARIEWLDALL